MISTLDVVGIVIGQIGTVLNALLFWVVGQNRRIDKKISFIYRNLAAADIFNSLVIPLCYLGVSGGGYILDPKVAAKNGIDLAFVVFLGIENIVEFAKRHNQRK